MGWVTHLCELFPLFFHTLWLLGPKVASDLGDFGVWQPRMLCYNVLMVVLSVQNEGYTVVSINTLHGRNTLTVPWSWDLAIRTTDANISLRKYGMRIFRASQIIRLFPVN
jgi:hypothetical protein